MTRILSCSDVHLTNYKAFNRPVDNPVSGSRLEYILQALDDFFDYGNEHDIHTFIINGDLFDQRQRENPSTIEYIRYRIISKFRQMSGDHNFLYINTGNHDQATRQITPSAVEHLDLYRTDSHFVQVMNDVTLITDYDHEYLFIPYSEDVQALKDKIKKTLYEDREHYPIYVFAHLGVDGAVQGRWNHRLSDAFSLDDLGYNDPRVKLITLGHFHTRSILRKDNHKEAYYQGDLTELSYNDIQENGLGAPRGFDVIDTETNTHEFIDLTKAPYNIPTFNQVTVDEHFDPKQIKDNAYYKLVTYTKENYEKVAEQLSDKIEKGLIQLVLIPQKHNEELQVNPNMTDKELVANYCDTHYPHLKKLALDYLRKAAE